MKTSILILIISFTIFACTGKKAIFDSPDEIDEICVGCCNSKYHFQNIEIDSDLKLINNKIILTTVFETEEAVKVNLEYFKKIKKYPFVGIYLVDRITDQDEELMFEELNRKKYISEKVIDKSNIKNLDVHIIYNNGNSCPSGVGYKIEISEILK